MLVDVSVGFDDSEMILMAGRDVFATAEVETAAGGVKGGIDPGTLVMVETTDLDESVGARVWLAVAVTMGVDVAD